MKTTILRNKNSFSASGVRRKRIPVDTKKGSIGKYKRFAIISGLAVVFFTASLLLFSENIHALFIDSSGNVGIGTETPGAKLDVNGNTRINGDLSLSGKIAGRIQDETGLLMPVGAILAYYGTTAPEGWLLCNGDTIPSEEKYDALRNLCEGNVPDLRGVFLRGLDNEIGIDMGRSLGSYQEDALGSHQHHGVAVTNNEEFSSTPNGNDIFTGHWNTCRRFWGWTRNEVIGALGLPYDGPETRPKNVAVNYIIKY